MIQNIVSSLDFNYYFRLFSKLTYNLFFQEKTK
jgi:hypothetical protein